MNKPSIFLTKVIQHPVDKVFTAFTKGDLMQRWFGPKMYRTVAVEVDFRVGGQYAITMEKSDGNLFFMKGKYEAIEQNRELLFTFCYDALPNPPFDFSIVHIHFTPIHKNQTEIRLKQEFSILPADYVKRTEAWEYMLQKLEEQA